MATKESSSQSDKAMNDSENERNEQENEHYGPTTVLKYNAMEMDDPEENDQNLKTDITLQDTDQTLKIDKDKIEDNNVFYDKETSDDISIENDSHIENGDASLLPEIIDKMPQNKVTLPTTTQSNRTDYVVIPAEIIQELSVLETDYITLCEYMDKRTLSHDHMDNGHTEKYVEVQSSAFFPRDNKASTKRREFATRLKSITARISNMSSECSDQEQQTLVDCLKQRDATIRKLKAEVTTYKERFEQKQRAIKQLCSAKDDSIWKVVKETEEENTRLRQELEELKENHVTLRLDFQAQSQELDRVKKQITCQESLNQEMFLKMYEKGKSAAWIERQEQIEELIEQSPSQVPAAEIIAKLKHTEQELSRWQSLVRRESYDEGEKPETESDAILKFMKDSMFHYLTDAENSAPHLRAMIRMLGFTDDEKGKIETTKKKTRKNSTI